MGVAVTIVALVGFLIFGPYKILGAVFAVDVGGKELKSTCTGIMGATDCVFAMFVLFGKGAIGDDWLLMFRALAMVSLVAAGIASAVWIRDLSPAAQACEREEPLLVA